MRDEREPEHEVAPPDPGIASVLRAPVDSEPPFDEVDWPALHERLLHAASERLRAHGLDTPWVVLARWARPVLPGAIAASSVLGLLLVMISYQPALETTDIESTATTAPALDAASGLEEQDPSFARLLAGDDQAILDAAM